jgi:hypothetical protein
MKKILAALFILIAGCDGGNSDIDKIITAKQKVKQMVNYPDTLSFHEFDTKVTGNTVTLKFSCKNAFGVPETHTMNISVP